MWWWLWVFFVGHFCGVSVLGVLFLRCKFSFSINTCLANFLPVAFQKKKNILVSKDTSDYENGYYIRSLMWFYRFKEYIVQGGLEEVSHTSITL